MTQSSCEQACSLCGVEFALELWPDVFRPTSTPISFGRRTRWATSASGRLARSGRTPRIRC